MSKKKYNKERMNVFLVSLLPMHQSNAPSPTAMQKTPCMFYFPSQRKPGSPHVSCHVAHTYGTNDINNSTSTILWALRRSLQLPASMNVLFIPILCTHLSINATMGTHLVPGVKQEYTTDAPLVTLSFMQAASI